VSTTGGRKITDLAPLKHGGRKIPLYMAGVVKLCLVDLMHNDPVSFYELVCMCRDPGYIAMTDSVCELHDRGMLNDDNEPSGLVRDVVLSAVEGHGFSMVIGNPFPDEAL
jgi:hypothetical protein